MSDSDSNDGLNTRTVVLVSFVATLLALAGGIGIAANFFERNAKPVASAAFEALMGSAPVNAQSTAIQETALRLAQLDYGSAFEPPELEIREYEVLVDLLHAYYPVNTERQLADAVETICGEQKHYPTLTRLECLDLLADTVSWSFAARRLHPPPQEDDATKAKAKKQNGFRLGEKYTRASNESIAVVAEDIRASLEEEALRPIYEAQQRVALAKTQLNAQLAAAREAALYRGAVRNEFGEALKNVRWLRYSRTGE